MKKFIPFFLALVLLCAIALLSIHRENRYRTVGQPHPHTPANLGGKVGHDMTGAKPETKETTSLRPAEVSPPSWRPADTFAMTAKPSPALVVPRGENASRRYHKVVSRDVDPEPSSAMPAVLAKSPEDGRFHLLPEEIDDHTRLAARMVFDPTSLDRIVGGTTSHLLAPTLTDEVLTLEFQKIKTRDATTHTLQGHVAGEENTSVAQVVYHDGILHGSVVRYDKQQEIEYRILSDGHMMVRELDHSTMSAGCATCSGEIMADVVDKSALEGDGPYDPSSEPDVPIANGTAGWRTMDVTVGYTIEARTADGGYSQIEARIIASVDRMTQAFANSAIPNTELVLLGTIEDPSYVEHATQKINYGQTHLRNLTDGELDVVYNFHTRLGSDFCSIVITGVQTGGVAGVAVSGSWSSSIARSQMTAGGMIMEHEIGHNLGGAHAWGDTSESNTGSNMGWRFKGASGTEYTTIMAYPHVTGWGPRIPYYSNPNVLHPDGNVPMGCVDGYDATNDPSVDPALKIGYDGSVPTRGANVAEVIDTGEGSPSYGATFAANRATRTNFELLAPTTAARWEKGTTRTISFNGGDMDDVVTIKLFKGGVLHTTLASGVNPVNHRNLAWEIPYSLTDGADYMIRVELTSHGSTTFADSGLFEIYSDLPHVNTASAPAVPTVIGQVSSVMLTFNVPMNPATFVAGTDVVSFINPEGSSLLGTITSATWSEGNTVLTIQFTPPSLQGSYQMSIGPDVEDTLGNTMDQDGDGTTGESAEDRFTTTFHVNPPLIRYDNMDTNPGYTFSANNPSYGWAWGQPTGGTGPSDGTSYPTQYGIADPTSGHTGANVIGYNLNGDYERGITSTRWATTPAMDCTNYQNVRLRFQRWLGVYYGASTYGGTLGDNAYIEVSNNGTTWTAVFHNTNSRHNTAAWEEVEYDISAVADGQSTVYVRWGMGRTNTSANDDSCGWNIDDVIVHGDYVDNSDTTPPYPSPMTFATPPTALGVSAATMSATTALDANGVEYYFDETSGNSGGTDSGWQDSPTYTDTGLQLGTQYTYTVKARDKSPNQNETTASSPSSATTDASATLTLVIAAASVSESGGATATTATVRRNTATTSSLVVNLSSNDTTEITVPASVTIAAGQSTSPVFNLNAVDDSIVDGTQTVTLTATASGHTNGTDTIDVSDDVPLTLTVITGANGSSSSGGGLKDPDGGPYAITANATTGYRFNNWTVTSGDASFADETTASTTVDTADDATVQANFVVATYTVTYAGNGSDGGSLPVDASSPYNYNSTVTVLGNIGALTRTGYSFAGWNTASNGGGTSYVAGNTFTITGETTLHAQWTPNTYTVNFDANGGDAPSPTSIPVSYGSPYGTLASVSRTGYTLTGWFTSPSGGTQVTSSTTVAITADQTLYAQWTISTYAITYDGNGNTGGTAPSGQTKTHNVDITLSGAGTLTKSGHVFVGWNTAADGSGIDYAADTTYSTNALLALYAKWDRIPTVLALSPAHTAIRVSPASNLVITLSENIAFGTGAITLRQSNGTLIESFNVAVPLAGLTLSGATVTLDPSSDLAAGTSYYVEIDATAINDLTGNSFAGFTGNGTWSFSTAEQAPVVLADSYLASLDVSTSTALYSSLNFPSYLDGPITGSAMLTTKGYFGSLLYLVHNGAGNTFSGNITVDSGTLRVGPNPFATTSGGFTAPGMTSSATLAVNRAGTLYIDDNSATGYTANRFGTSGSRPALNLAGGRVDLNGLSNASSSVQTLGALTLSSGASTINVIRNSIGNPTLTFASLTKNSGASVNLTGTALGTGTNDARILFSAAPALTGGSGAAGTKTMSILAGARSGNDFVWHDSTTGIRPLLAAEYNDFETNDINTAGSSENVRITGATPTTVVALGADKTINSLIMTAGGNLTWAMGNKLTLTSGQFMSTAGNSRNITSGIITAGSGSAIDLNMNILTNTTTVGTSANINDNGGSGVVTLVKAGTGVLALSNHATNNGYSGGTFVTEGTLNTGTTADRRYLGSGKVTVDNATLTLGNIGATSNTSGDDYTAINGGKINIASGTTGAYTSADTFNVAANSIIAGGSAAGQGLASLTRGTNITLALGAIIAHNALSTALNTSTGTIQNLGTSADLYYGLNANQTNAGGSIHIGGGTAFMGISTDRSGRNWEQGTIDIAMGTTSVDFQGHATHGSVSTLTLGNGTTAGGPVITFAGSGTVDINAIGLLTLNDDTAVYGNSSSSPNIRFVATAGSTLTVTAATGMGSGNGIASALVNNGASLAIGNTASLNGSVTVESGGRIVANQAAGLTGSGLLTFEEGSIINITHATGWSGAQASAASIAAGTIVRLGITGFGAVDSTLDSIVGGSSPIYQLTGSYAAANPTLAGTTIMTLNKNGSGIGGILTNDVSGRTLSATTNGQITIGANGGVIAATSNTELQVQENIEGANVTLTIGTTDIIDGAPKLGTVALGSASGSNGYTGQTIINAGTVRPGYPNVLGALTNQLTVNAGGTLNMSGSGSPNQAVGNLTGTGGVISLGGQTLTIGEGGNGGGNYQGSIQGSNGKVTKTGNGTITLSGTNTYTGITTISAGKLFINGNHTSATGNISVAANATLGGSGTLGASVTISANGKLEFDLSTPAGGHNPLDFVTGKGLTLSGASELSITSSGGAGPGIYTLVTGGNNISYSSLPALNLPVGWAASLSISGNSLQLNVATTSTPGPVDHFVISPISSPQTVGTPITGITITAQDANNETATSFVGAVTFGGSAEISGTSANFVNGVLSGVSITPMADGPGLTFTVDDGAGHTGSVYFTVQSLFEDWAGSRGLTGGEAGPGVDPDGDGLTNLQEFAFGTNPASGRPGPIQIDQDGKVVAPGLPDIANFATPPAAPDFRALYPRRKDHVMAGLIYTVEFSADLTRWTASNTGLEVLSTESVGAVNAVSVPFPLSVPVTVGDPQPPKFFRVMVTGN